MRAAQDARAELDGFDWVLPAMLDERAANEGQRRELIEQSQLANGVGEVELRICANRLARRTPRNGKMFGFEQGGDGLAALRMTRHDDSQKRRHRA